MARGRPPVRPRARAACRPAVVPLADEGGLELGQGAEDVEDKQPGRGRGVDALSQGPEPHLDGPGGR